LEPATEFVNYWIRISSLYCLLVLVSLAASLADPELPKAAHYLDDIQVRIITHDFIP
jgi:hypothetical protein